jgi:hypothetical protein
MGLLHGVPKRSQQCEPVDLVADTFGAMTEWFANEPSPFDTPDYSVGEKINLVGSGPIRYM